MIICGDVGPEKTANILSQTARPSASLQAPDNVCILFSSFTKHAQKRIRALCESCTALMYTRLCSVVHLIVCIRRSLVFRDGIFDPANDI